MRLWKPFVLAGLVVSASLPAVAGTIEVRMLNRGEHGSMVFEPDYVALRPGGSIRFRVGHRSHNAASIEGMAPEGYDGFKGQIDEEIIVTFERAGFYGIKCSPHFGMGMVMLVRVGDTALPDGFLDVDMPARPRKRFEEILTRAEGAGQ